VCVRERERVEIKIKTDFPRNILKVGREKETETEAQARQRISNNFN
jgi:hypothetical protein